MRLGVRAVDPNIEVDVCPLSDGGEGLLDVLVSAMGGTVHEAEVTGSGGHPARVPWAMLSDGRTAAIETAAVVGTKGRPEGATPAQLTTYGVGQLLLEAAAGGAKKILVGLGGTATTDGGSGMAQALGVRFERAPLPITGGALNTIERITRPVARVPALAEVEIVALADVDNPLTGPDGSAHVYGPQKGATAAEVSLLDAGLRRLAERTGDPGIQPGDGAAGGLGFGLRVFAGARVTRGVELVLDAVSFDRRLEGCDVVLTGEGRLDAQSARGKVVAGVSGRCKARRIPAVALVGAIGPGAEVLRELGLTAFFSLVSDRRGAVEARENAAALLADLAESVVRLRAHLLQSR
jgi:glycerate kinase